MSMTVIVHIRNAEPMLAEIDEMPQINRHVDQTQQPPTEGWQRFDLP